MAKKGNKKRQHSMGSGNMQAVPSLEASQNVCRSAKAKKNARKKKKKKNKKTRYKCPFCPVGPMKWKGLEKHFNQYPSHRAKWEKCISVLPETKPKSKKGKKRKNQAVVASSAKVDFDNGLEKKNAPGYRCPHCFIGPYKWHQMCIHFECFPLHRAEQLTCWNTLPGPGTPTVPSGETMPAELYPPSVTASSTSPVTLVAGQGVWNERQSTSSSSRSSSSSSSAAPGSSAEEGDCIALPSSPASTSSFNIFSINQMPPMQGRSDVASQGSAPKACGEDTGRDNCGDEACDRKVDVAHEDIGGEPEIASSLAHVEKPDYSCGSGSNTFVLRDWLKNLDSGQGALLQYEDAITHEFDGNLRQVAASFLGRVDGQSIVHAIDSLFWEAVGVNQAGHKLLFARGIEKLQ